MARHYYPQIRLLNSNFLAAFLKYMPSANIRGENTYLQAIFTYPTKYLLVLFTATDGPCDIRKLFKYINLVPMY